GRQGNALIERAGVRDRESCSARPCMRLIPKFDPLTRFRRARSIEWAAMIITEQKSITRRQFVSCSALLMSGISLSPDSPDSNLVAEPETAFSAVQQRRRAALWDLLGDLPWQHEPAASKLIGTEEHDHYTLERLVLDLNGIEPVPALLLIPKP